MRRAQTEFLDRGLTVLYVAFGTLDWCDLDGTAMVSPLLLAPVQLLPEGPKGTPRITHGEDDPVLNPALVLRMKEFGIELPTAEGIEGVSVTALLAAVRRLLEKSDLSTGWSLRESTYLGMFSFSKEAMFKDLLDNEEVILEHPVVRALATSDVSQQSPEFQFDPINPADIDRLAQPELTPLVLDADSSQRAAVAAALSGHSFVMDGPPGTGKSQTIANMIGALIHAGKTVLFVSEKMAALDVVRNRLAAAGLGSYLLELHSRKASRKEVATELLKTLDNIAKPPVAMPSITRQNVKDRRERLNGYATAMNEVREPLKMSLHHVLGLYAALSAAPVAPVPENALIDLTEAEYLGIQDTLAKLARAWRPAMQGQSFLWREVTDELSLEVRLYQAQQALEQLRGTVALNADLVDAFNLTKPSDTPRLRSLIEHQHEPHPAGVMEQWLMADSTRQLEGERANLGRHMKNLKDAEAAVIQAAGVPRTEFPPSASIAEAPLEISARPAPIELADLRATQLLATAKRFETDVKMLGELAVSLGSLARSLGLRPVASFTDVDSLGRLIDLGSMKTRPDRRWFTASGLAAARMNAATLRERAAALAEAEEKASSTFTSDALDAPVSDLQDRFTTLHKGLKKLSRAYRSDKKAIAALLTDAADVKDGIDHLADAIAWEQANNAFHQLASTVGGSLGPQWHGRDTDFDALGESLDVVEEVLTLVDDPAPAPLVAFLTGSEQSYAYQKIVDSARAEINTWRLSLLPTPALAGRPELLLGSVGGAIDWLTTHVRPMREAANRASVVNNATGRDHTVFDASEILELIGYAENAAAELRDAEPTYTATFGEYFTFEDTDLEAIDLAIDWLMSVRSLAEGPLTVGQIKALVDSNVVDGLELAFERWVQARDHVVDAFAASRHSELTAEFDNFEDAAELIDDLRADTVGQQEWFEYRRAYDDLVGRGLGTAVDFCVEQRLSENDVPGVVNRALLRSWSDGIIQGDDRLRPLLAQDREALVNEYRALDRDLIKAATADVIKSANTRRPGNTTIGEPGVIRREGGKQKRHKPVRELVAMTRNVTQSIKPVFMMSPLAVSQYLPSDMNFDVVIFDEASQVTPGDAINCIYRGNALILAGDDKQLPPTSFFERNIDDEDTETDVQDFQSVLELAKAAGAFNSLGLKWHYRSRHEDLIAFSNYKFYEGKLITYPSAHAEGDDVGVEFYHAHGVYRRGGGAFNPIEAAKVAERVIEHFTNRPELTLGVVTFSVAQADAVQTAIEEARISRRDLDGYFDSEDRLDGFFIRALEQVQGDERDVVIFSVGYGPDEAGKISTNFGALNKDKGWRRLNVGITRARQRVEIVASMHAGEIPPSVNESVEYFRAYLDYAEKGPQVLAVPYSSTGLDPESPFEESVIAAVQGWGYTVEPQVGAAGFRIDIGVRHPAYPGMFAIGIECDGYQYHSAPAARDRDRIREEILTGLGWRLHRIWGTAWYRDRAIEEQRLRIAIENAIAAPLDGRTKKTPAIEYLDVMTEQIPIAVEPTWTSPYRVAPKRSLPHWVDPGGPGNHLHMVDAITSLVRREGPVHLDVAFERLREWWGIGRVGSNIRNNINLAIQSAPVVLDGDFLILPGKDVSKVRTPTSDVTRKAEHVHLDELALAVDLTIRDVGAVSRDEVAQSVARIYGWARTGAIVWRRINDAIDELVGDGKLVNSGGTLTSAEST